MDFVEIVKEITIFQSTSSVWRTTPPLFCKISQGAISIHVLRVEDDPLQKVPRGFCRISIHVLRVEDDRKEFT